MRPGYTADCRGVLLPTSWVADYEKLSAYNKLLVELYRVDTTSLEFKLQYTLEMLENERKPVPLLEKPSFWTGVGIITGAAAVIGGGYAISAGGRS